MKRKGKKGGVNQDGTERPDERNRQPKEKRKIQER